MITDKAREDLKGALSKRKDGRRKVDRTFLDDIMRLRKKHDLTITEAAEGTGYTRQHLSQMLKEHGMRGEIV